MPNTTAALTRAIRQRMSSLDDAELLRLWVENDRGHYSDEAFEAVRDVLTERGVELPLQNDPPPMAARAPRVSLAAHAADPATVAFWTAWLRPLLWVGIILGAAKFLGGAANLFTYYQMSPPGRGLLDWAMPMVVSEWLLGIAVPACLVAGAGGALRLRPWARRVLLIYAWVSLGLVAFGFVAFLYGTYASYYAAPPYRLIAQLAALPERVIYPLLVLLLFRRPPIRELFEPAVAGFEVRQGGTA